MEANKIAITDEALRRGAEEGMDGFLKVFIDKYLEAVSYTHLKCKYICQDRHYLSGSEY